MKILLFSKILAKTGVGNHIKQLAEELVAQGHSVWIVSGSNEQGISDSENLKFIKLSLSTKNPFRFIKNLKILHAVVKSNEIEVVHCHHRLASLYMKFYRMFWKVPVVYSLHSAPVPHGFLHRKLTYVGDMGIGVSTEVAKFMEEKLRIPKEKISIVQNGVKPPLEKHLIINRQELLNKFQIPSGKYIILLNSRIDPIKNHMIMIEAINELPAEIRGKTVVVCTGEKTGEYYESVVSKIREYGLHEQFIFVGWVDPYEISSISDILFLPSLKEGFALSVTEAFFMKLPVARTETGGWEDTGSCCLKIRHDKTDEIKAIITKLVTNGPDVFREQAEKAYSYASKYLTIQSMTSHIVDTYKSVCSSH